MKKALLLLAFVATMMAASAQKPLSYDFVIQKEGATDLQIYNSLIDWIATSFKAVDGDFYRDKEEKTITKDVAFDFNTSKIMMSCYNGTVTYKLKFQCREGRFKVVMTNFEHSVKPGNSTSCILGSIMDQPVADGNGGYDRKAWEKVKEATDAEAARIQSMMEALEISTADDDW